MNAASSAMSLDPALDNECINTLRFLSVDAVQKAESRPSGFADGLRGFDILHSLDPIPETQPSQSLLEGSRPFCYFCGPWFDVALFTFLHLCGYDSVSLEDIKQFRQWGSKTPGHPEQRDTPGVETTTGPLGQGAGNAVGIAIAEAYLAARDFWF